MGVLERNIVPKNAYVYKAMAPENEAEDMAASDYFDCIGEGFYGCLANDFMHPVALNGTARCHYS